MLQENFQYWNLYNLNTEEPQCQMGYDANDLSSWMWSSCLFIHQVFHGAWCPTLKVEVQLKIMDIFLLFSIEFDNLISSLFHCKIYKGTFCKDRLSNVVNGRLVLSFSSIKWRHMREIQPIFFCYFLLLQIHE